MDSHRFNTKLLEKDAYKKYNKQSESILFKPLSYQKKSTILYWKANHEKAIFDIASTWSSYTNLMKVCLKIWLYSEDTFILFHVLPQSLTEF